MTKLEANKIYQAVNNPYEVYKDIDLAIIVEFVEKNYWWISLIGKKIYRFIVRKIKERKEKRNSK